MIAVCDHSDFKMDVLLVCFSADISGFAKKQVETYVLIYVSYHYLNCAQTAGLVCDNNKNNHNHNQLLTITN